MHKTLLLCYGIMHGRETLMCSLDKEALILEKSSRGVSERKAYTCDVFIGVRDEMCFESKTESKVLQKEFTTRLGIILFTL